MMIRHYNIRDRKIGMCTEAPETLEVDALVLPWSGHESEYGESSVMSSAGQSVRNEIDEYNGEREVMLTSGGLLPVRFLFHLTLPESGAADLRTIEDRFRDCFFQAGVLGIQELAISLPDFTAHVDSFADLVARIWETSREFLARDRGPRRLILLIDDRDLRGQYLRHFLDRKEEEDRQWERLDGARVTTVTKVEAKPPASLLDTPRRTLKTEQVLNLDPVGISDDPHTAEQELAEALDALLEDYQAGRTLAGNLDRLSPAMSSALAGSLSSGSASPRPLGDRLRVLGNPLAMRLPWELLQEKDGLLYLGEGHLFTRGTNFLHFRRHGKAQPTDLRKVSLRVMGETPSAQSLSGSIQELVILRELDLLWSTESEAAARLVHCLDAGALEALRAEEDPACELVFADLPPGESPACADEIGETARHLLAQGCRHVLAPLAPFRSSSERDAFRAAFYERLLAGATPGESLQYAQRVLMETFGMGCGWWLYRLYGQTDFPLIPGKAGGRKTVPQPG